MRPLAGTDFQGEDKIYRLWIRISVSIFFLNHFFFGKESVGKITFSMLYWLKYLRMKSFLFVDMYDNKLLAPATWEPLGYTVRLQFPHLDIPTLIPGTH